MLTPLLHAGRPPAPHDLWGSWTTDPLLILGLLGLSWMYARGRRSVRPGSVPRWRDVCFAAAIVALAVALVSPLDAASSALASAHMIQHVLLILVAAPLLALSAPSHVLLVATPLALRRRTARAWGRLRAKGPGASGWGWLVAGALHAATIWLWHAAVPYDAALEHRPVHMAEHATFLATGLLFWHVVLGRGRLRVSPGLGVLLVFGVALQATFLSVLLTFAREPWYGYGSFTAAWGLSPLADQQLAGAIMWVPAGFVYLAAGLWIAAVWVRDNEERWTATGNRAIDRADPRRS